MKIRYLDMFAGAGGFRSGLANVGDFFVPVGWCEIDKYAQRAYRALYETEGEYFCEDARQINPSDLPDIDLICGGFPCQSFSIAGKRGGFSDARGTLFFEIARIAAAKRPACLLLENVPGLLSHDRYRTFATILGTLSELGYDVTWNVYNSADFGVRQTRRRLYLVGFHREKCAGKLLPFVEEHPISRDLDFRFIDLNREPKLTQFARCLTTRQKAGIGKHKGERSGVFIEDSEHPDIVIKDDFGRIHRGTARNLTPRECFRLQGFTDEQFDKLVAEGIPESQLYKLAGNSVTVNVVEAVGRFLVEEVL